MSNDLPRGGPDERQKEHGPNHGIERPSSEDQLARVPNRPCRLFRHTNRIDGRRVSVAHRFSGPPRIPTAWKIWRKRDRCETRVRMLQMLGQLGVSWPRATIGIWVAEATRPKPAPAAGGRRSRRPRISCRPCVYSRSRFCWWRSSTGCAAERTIYRDSDGRIQEQWKCPYAACLGIGHIRRERVRSGPCERSGDFSG
jgi:hypothetical protein